MWLVTPCEREWFGFVDLFEVHFMLNVLWSMQFGIIMGISWEMEKEAKRKRKRGGTWDRQSERRAEIREKESDKDDGMKIE